jgi:hypothetical protein
MARVAFSLPERIRSDRLSELFCCLAHAQAGCVQAIAIAFKRFLLHESDDFCLVTLFEQHPQLSL